MTAMKKILFVCHGNICRSTMAEFLMKDLVRRTKQEGQFLIESAGTSDEEEGCPVHVGTRRILDARGIDPSGKRARKITYSDYDNFDMMIGMDRRNVMDLIVFFGGDREGKISLFLSHAGEMRDVADPWYTGDFNTTYKDVMKGLNALAKELGIDI